jgi:hypothetical protein
MASEERIRALLSGADFTAVRTEEVSVRFAFRDPGDYVSYASDTAGPFAIVLRGLSDGERRVLQTQLTEAFAGFLVNGGYELPGLSLAAVAN